MRLVSYIVVLASAGAVFATRDLKIRQALEPADVPSECTTICAPIFTDVQSCGSKNTACLCTASVRSDGIACADCIASVLPSTLQALQAEADASVEACQQAGHIIEPATITPTSPTSGSSGPAAPANSGGSGGSSSDGTGNSGGSTSGDSNTPSKSGAYGLSDQLQILWAVLSSAGVVLFGFY